MKYACLLAFLGLMIPLAKATEWDKRTIVKFNEPVEVPGVVLPAGTYVMKLVDSPSSRDIVQFFNRNETQVYATTIAIPEYRMEPTDHTVINFEERRAGSPQAIRDWYYPGDLIGEQFLYRETQQMAAATEPPQQMKPARSPLAEATPEPAPAARPVRPKAEAAPTPVPAPAPQPVQMAKAEPAAAPPAAPAPQTNPPKELPKTGSDLPLIGLLGGVSIAAGLGLCLRRA